MKETENKSPYPILSVNGRKGQSGEGFQNPPKSPLISGTGRSSFLFPSRGGGTFCEAKGGGAFGRGVRAFTLVELIIVITILAILATIAFISFQGYTSKSRDANRASTAKNIETGLELFQTKSGVYPIQSTGATISVSGSQVTVQGDLDLSIARVINLNEVPRDPKTGEMYHYISDTKGRGGKVLYYLENTPDYAFLTQSFAESETRTPIAKGQGPGVLLDTGSQMVTKNVDLFGATQSGETFTILVNDTTKVIGSGLALGGGFQMFAEKGGRLDAPKTCPTGFIAVPGNAEFMQPGFCVAKYEMSYDETTPSDVTTGTDWNTRKYNSGKIPVSMANRLPITELTQQQAINVCNAIGKHLITNNEWMTIARNIEANGVNWSSGTVGSEFLYNGVSHNTTMGCTGYYDGKWAGVTGRECSEKRGDGKSRNVLVLNNGEEIYDLSGNVWEHVNKANTIDGGKFNVGKLKFDDNRDHWNIINSGATNYYQWHTGSGWGSSSIPDEIRKKYGPSKSTYTHTTNGVGNIHGWYTSDTTQPHNIFLRGGDVSYADYAGVFTMYLRWTSSDLYNSVGFRCAF